MLIAPDYPPIVGGAEIFTGILAERLAQRHTVQVVTRQPTAAARRISNLGGDPLPPRERRNGVDVIRTGYLEIADLRMLTAIPGLLLASLNLARQQKPDLIHTVAFYPTLAIGRLVKQFAGVPLVHTEQGLITDVLRGNVNILDRYGGLLRGVTHWSFAGADAVTCVSSTVAERVAQYYPLPDRIQVIPNGVDTRLFQPATDRHALRQALGLPEGFIFFSASRLVEKNGLETLVRAVGRLPPTHRPVSVIIAGDGDLRATLENRIADLGLAAVVRLIGALPHAELPRWLAASDAFVRPSVSEGFGIAFVEAMACGLPLIATPVITQMGIFHAGQQGLVAPVDDAAALAQRMLTLVNDESTCAQMAAKARHWAVEQYDWDAIVIQIEKVYEKVIKH
jgi:glycogen(starch) synthase